MASDFIVTNGTSYLRRPRETSPLLPLRDPTAQNQMWKMVEKLGKRVANLTNLLQQVNARVARAERWGTVPRQDEFFPFKVYQPNLLQLPPFGVIYDQYGTATVININSAVPTNLAASPPTVNPKTDGWRFLAVRNGIFQINSIYSIPATDLESNAAFGLYDIFDFNNDNWFGTDSLITGVDGIGSLLSQLSQGNTGTVSPIPNGYDAPTSTVLIDPNSSAWGSVIVIDGASPPSNYVIWLQIDNESNQDDSVAHVLVKASSSDYFPNSSTYPSFQANATIIPIAIVGGITTNAPPDSIRQLAFDHFINRAIQTRYTNTNLQPYMIDSTLNYVGNWQADTASPINIQDRIFQPGDYITYTETGQSTGMTYNVSGGGGGSIAVTLNFSTDYTLMMTAYGTTTDPLTDDNWVTISEANFNFSFS